MSYDLTLLQEIAKGLLKMPGGLALRREIDTECKPKVFKGYIPLYTMKKRVVGTNKFSVLIICLVLVYSAAAIGGIFTKEAVDSPWYSSVKPDLAPPNYVFPVVWNVLFLLIALSLFFVFTSKNKKGRKTAEIFFGINLILNVLWSILYFGFRSPISAFVEIIVLWASIVGMIYYSYGVSKKAAYLLIPYLLWVSFAIILNYLSI